MSPTRFIISPWMLWFPAALFYCYQFILRVSPSIMVNELMLDFGVTAGGLGALTAFYYYGYSAVQIPLGVLVDYFGPRKLLTCAALLCSASTALFASATDLHIAQLARFLMGIGSSCAFLGCMKLGTVWFAANQLPMITGVTMIFGVLGANFGGAPLCMLANFYDWRMSLLIVSAFGVLIAGAIWIIDRDEQSSANQEAKMPFLAGLKLILSTRQVWLGAIYGFMIYTPLSVFADLWGVSFIAKMYNISPEKAALYLTVIYMGWAIGALFYAFAVKRFITMITGFKLASLSTGMIFSGVLFMPDISSTLMIVLLFSLGLSLGGQSLIFSFTCAHMPVQVSGVTIGFTNMLCMLSGVIFQPIVGMILDWGWTGEVGPRGIHVFGMEDFRMALLAIPVCIAISFVLSFFLKEKVASRVTSNI